MSTIKITGTFKNSSNNDVVIDVYKPNPNGYEFKRDYSKSFVKTLSDLEAGLVYYIDFSGNTTGTFDISVDGDVDAAVSGSYSNFFVNGLTFKTT